MNHIIILQLHHYVCLVLYTYGHFFPFFNLSVLNNNTIHSNLSFIYDYSAPVVELAVGNNSKLAIGNAA